MPEFEPDEYLQVWTFTAEDALAFFGLSAAAYEVTILKAAPTTERERARYKPEAKLFGIRAIPAVPGAHATPAARLSWCCPSDVPGCTEDACRHVAPPEVYP